MTVPSAPGAVSAGHDVDRGVTVVAVALPEEAEHIEVADGEVLVITGIGKVRAAATLATFLAVERPRRRIDGVLNLGTAGSLVDHLHGIVEPSHLIEHDLDAETIEALIGRPVPVRHDLPAAAAAGGGDVTLATGDRFVSDPAHVAALLARGVHLVDMEAAALHAACAQHGVPFRTVKYVSDRADEHAFRSWRATVAEASARLGAWLVEERTAGHRGAVPSAG